MHCFGISIVDFEQVQAVWGPREIISVPFFYFEQVFTHGIQCLKIHHQILCHTAPDHRSYLSFIAKDGIIQKYSGKCQTQVDKML